MSCKACSKVKQHLVSSRVPFYVAREGCYEAVRGRFHSAVAVTVTPSFPTIPSASPCIVWGFVCRERERFFAPSSLVTRMHLLSGGSGSHWGRVQTNGPSLNGACRAEKTLGGGMVILILRPRT